MKKDNDAFMLTVYESLPFAQHLYSGSCFRAFAREQLKKISPYLDERTIGIWVATESSASLGVTHAYRKDGPCTESDHSDQYLFDGTGC